MGSRLTEWKALFVSSIVSLVSVISVLEEKDELGQKNRQTHENWVLTVASISVGVSAIGLLATQFMPTVPVKIEGALILVALGFWSAGMPAIVDPDHDLAVNADFGVGNANLYFFSWGALGSSVALAGDFAREVQGETKKGVRVYWVLLAAASAVVMGTGAAVYKNDRCKILGQFGQPLEEFCTRTRFAIYYGLLSNGISVAMILAKKDLSVLVRLVLAVFLGFGWACGVGLLTFGEGPGAAFGNIYFATYAALFCSFALAVDSFKKWRGIDDDEEEEKKKKAGKDPKAGGKNWEMLGSDQDEDEHDEAPLMAAGLASDNPVSPLSNQSEEVPAFATFDETADSPESSPEQEAAGPDKEEAVAQTPEEPLQASPPEPSPAASNDDEDDRALQPGASTDSPLPMDDDEDDAGVEIFEDEDEDDDVPPPADAPDPEEESGHGSVKPEASPDEMAAANADGESVGFQTEEAELPQDISESEELQPPPGLDASLFL